MKLPEFNDADIEFLKNRAQARAMPCDRDRLEIVLDFKAGKIKHPSFKQFTLLWDIRHRLDLRKNA